MSLEKMTANYLTFFNLDQKKFVLNMNQNVALNHLSVSEEAFRTALKPKKVALNKKKISLDSNFKSFSGLTQLRGSHLNFKRSFSTSSKKSGIVGYMKPPILYWPKRYPFYIRPLKKPEPLPWVKERRERQRQRQLKLLQERRDRMEIRFMNQLERRIIQVVLHFEKRQRKMKREKDKIWKVYNRILKRRF
jgi:hypothetical protein